MTDQPSAPPALWAIAPLETFVVPGDTQINRVRRGWRALGGVFGMQREATRAEHERTERELRALPELRLAHVVRPIDWSSAADALEGARETAGCCLLVTPPYGGHAEVVSAWAERQGAALVAPPPPGVLLEGPCAPAALPADVWALPRLECCFLRHAAGLSFVRDLLARVLAGGAGRGVIGCSSWAWQYLQRLVPLAALPALTLAPFDGPRLSRLLLDACGGGRPVRYLSARSGEPLRPADGDDAAAHAELRQLAAHCRGNPGIAWHYWRGHLREEFTVEPVAPGASAAQTVVWYDGSPPGTLDSGAMADDEILLLHALVLHGPLPAELLAELLSLRADRIAGLLARLRACGLVDTAAARWQVTPLTYPSLRELLRSHDYPMDAF